jgi:hypothetical protein
MSPVFLHNYEKGKWREGGRTAMPYPQKHPLRALIVQEERAL